MLIFNCTEAATDFFTTTQNGNKTSPMSPKPGIGLAKESTLHDAQRWHWMIHVKKFNRKNVLLVMDSDSRFCMVFWGLRKGDLQGFLEQFHERFALHIIAALNMGGQDESMFEKSMKTFLETHHEYAFVQRGDRSTQAHIKDAFMHLQYQQYRWEEDVPNDEELFVSDLRLNDTPRKRKQDKDYIFPTEVFFTIWLDRYANLNKKTITDTINQYRQKNSQLWRFSLDFGMDDLDFDEIETEIVETPSDNVISFEAFAKKT